jgi:hypothetical protein
MSITKGFKNKVEMTRVDGFFRLLLNDGVSLALLVEFAHDMFPGVRAEDIDVWPAEDDELVVSVRGGAAVGAN